MKRKEKRNLVVLGLALAWLVKRSKAAADTAKIGITVEKTSPLRPGEEGTASAPPQ